jgi:hypothetical protein
MGLLGRFHRKEEKLRPGGFSQEAVVDSVLHPSSFSFVVFRGECSGQLPALLAACRYTVLRAGRIHANPVELHDALGKGGDRSIVLKAYRSCPDMTVLVDAELVVATACEAELAGFCREWATEAICAVWERISETAWLGEITAQGVQRKTWYEQGAPGQEQVDPGRRSPTSRTTRASRRPFAQPASTLIFCSPRPK